MNNSRRNSLKFLLSSYFPWNEWNWAVSEWNMVLNERKCSSEDRSSFNSQSVDHRWASFQEILRKNGKYIQTQNRPKRLHTILTDGCSWWRDQLFCFPRIINSYSVSAYRNKCWLLSDLNCIFSETECYSSQISSSSFTLRHSDWKFPVKSLVPNADFQ